MPLRVRLTGRLALAVFLVTVCASCLVRRRQISHKRSNPSQKLITTDKKTLIDRIASIYGAVNSFSATVDMVPALGSVDSGHITEYKDVRAYILFRKPNFIRLIGLYPVVRNKAFDMVSDGSEFKLYIPGKNRFVQGRNEIAAPSPNKMENLRPQHFLEALIVQPVDSDRDLTIVENFTDEENADYVLYVVNRAPDGQLYFRRNVWFDRFTLRIIRQKVFSAAGAILTDARYSEWKSFDGVPFPSHIEINRPTDEYGVVISITKMDINKEGLVTDEKFVLERPENTELQVLGPLPGPSPDTTPAGVAGAAHPALAPARDRKKK
ncbi:MAG: DUF4292 domain-containing protein [Bryobacterales bacterium]|nr:DUF4292 domain-containing protein [Bryobacterales bacterium]